MDPRSIFWLCLLLHMKPGNCESNESGARVQEQISDFTAHITHESLDNSAESIPTSKKIVKRLIRENNEQSGIQASTGQPGVDFPTLTKIPATSFSCRGLKGGYYADLETNCQVFHICDNSRKISFLCPNGTIFQQSQLICDWWFKVDCSKSTELYEQSAEQLAEDERKRADAKRINSEFRRPLNDDVGQKYYHTSKTNYDGKQNGRTNPYGNAAKNQLTENEQRPELNIQTPTRSFDPNQIFSQQNARVNNQFTLINDLVPPLDGISNGNANDNDDSSAYTESDNIQNTQNFRTPAISQSPDTQRNQIINERNSGAKQQFNYDQRASNKYSAQTNRYQDENDYSRATEQRNKDRGRKYKTFNLNEDDTNERATPLYTETTTFRTSTPSPIKEYQQLAESAAFATARVNRVNKVYSNNHFNYRSNEVSTAASTLQPSTVNQSRIVNLPFSLTSKKNIPVFPHATFAPIYKPRTTPYDPTTIITTSSGINYNRWDRHESTTEFDQTSTTPYTTIQNYYYKTTHPSTSFTDVVTETQDWISTTPDYSDMSATVTPYSQEEDSSERFTSQEFGNARYSNINTPTPNTRDYSHSSYTTPRTFTNSQTTRRIPSNLRTSTESNTKDSESVTTNFSVNTVTSSDRNSLGTTRSYVKDNRAERNGRNRSNIGRGSMRSWQNYRQNAISPSTEKSPRINPSHEHGNFANERTPKPYDTSFTFKQGKILSTLAPYVPFTKNYAYTTTTTTTTVKPPVYTATVPTYTTTNSQYRAGSRTFNTIDNVTPTPINGPRRSSTYLPNVKSDISTSRRTNLDQRPVMERQHALNMLQSLRGLDRTVPTATGNKYGNRSGLKIPHSSSPATLHSLALYFSTASDSNKTSDGNHDVDKTNSNESKNFAKNEQLSSDNNQTVELPSSILTQHTIKSYADLFNLNNAFEGNVTVNTKFLEADDDENTSEEVDTDDLDLQQSRGPLDGVKKSNATKLRELAKIFTHALSAYLQDPDTFKKILTEIRPTVPSYIDDDVAYAVTASTPTTIDDYPSVTKEKDEVLDFSDDVTPSKFKRPTTIIPPTSTDIPIISDDGGFGYYTTSIPSFDSGYQTTTLTPFTENDEQLNESHDLSNNFASQVNNAFDVFPDNNRRGENRGHTAPTFNDPTTDYDNYFPSGELTYNNEVGDVQQNNTTTYEPYGKYVKPLESKPIQYNNYEQSSTPSSYEETSPPLNYKNSNKNVFNHLKEEFDESTSSTVEENFNVPTTPGEPFRIRYYDQGSTTIAPEYSEEFLVTANSINPNYNNINNGFSNNIGKNNQTYSASTEPPSQTVTSSSPSPRYRGSSQSYRNFDDHNESTLSQKVGDTNSVDNDSKMNNHWTSSPSVTQLWESTVFYDPKHINQGLSLHTSNNPSSFEYVDSVPTATTYSPVAGSQEILVTDAANGVTSRFENTQKPSTPWQWSTTSTETNAPTTFTLLPNTHSTDQTATPTPIFTTRSSITTTITSSITSTSSLPTDNGTKNLDSDIIYKNSASDRDNEIVRAKEMFGNLNVTSTDKLMKVMKHADENANVKRLVLLLINHCNGPMNKTKEQEKEELLNALLRTPVNEFTSEESRDLIDGISKLNLPIGSADDLEAKSTSNIVSSPKPPVTTYRNRNSRRNRVSNRSSSSTRRSGNSDNRIKSVKEIDSAASDERALEVLRSLYSIAAKWG